MIKKSIFFVCVLLFTADVTFSQKVGFVDSQSLLAEMQEVKDANATIESLKNELLVQGRKMVEMLEAKAIDLEKRRNELPPIQFESETKSLQEEEKKIGEFEQKSQLNIYNKSQELLTPIQQKVDAAIKAVASENGLTYIFDTSLGMILYSDAALNVYDKVKAKLSTANAVKP